jgi:hypothetical protein
MKFKAGRSGCAHDVMRARVLAAEYRDLPMAHRFVSKQWALAFVAAAWLGIADVAKAQDLSGRWTGHWEDSRSGHCGPLRATICKCDDQHYQAVFTGRYFGVLPFRFRATLTVTGQHGDKVLLAGDSRVGLSGSFRYSAEATATEFVADYCARRYEGRFVLTKSCP